MITADDIKRVMAAPVTKPQSVLDIALQGVDDPLEVVASILSDIHEYLESRDGCWGENIDKATDAIYAAFRRIKCQQEDIEDAGGDDNTEHKKADDRQRARDVHISNQVR